MNRRYSYPPFKRRRHAAAPILSAALFLTLIICAALPAFEKAAPFRTQGNALQACIGESDRFGIALSLTSPSLIPAYAAFTPAQPADDSGAGDPAVPFFIPAETSGAENADVPQTAEVSPPRTETTITGGAGYLSAAGLSIKNKSKYDIDIDSFLNADPGFRLGTAGPQALIIHTHGSEAYTPDGDDLYTESDPSRTEDTRYNVVRVGDELAQILTERGIEVIHDRKLYDYPSYTGSYGRSLEAINAYLADNPSIKIVIDLHRDALIGEDGTVYKTVADIGDEQTAQIMIIAGTDSTGLQHPAWRQNLAFAMRLQAAVVSKYPTLARPLTVSQYRYNQQATTGSIIVEVGCNGNTLQEALGAIRCFGDAAADVMLSLTEEQP